MTSESTITGTVGLYVSATFIISYGFLFWGFVIRRRLTSTLNCIADRRKTRSRVMSILYWTSPMFFVALWSLISHSGIAPNQSIPTPVEFARSFWGLTLSGTLPTEALISFSRVAVGFTAAAFIGVPLGLLAGTFVVGRSLIGPTNSFFRYIPPTAFIALLIVYFGVGEQFKYAVVFLGVVFFITQMVIDVVDDMDSRYVEIALTSGLSNWEVFRKTIIPFCSPRIFDVLRINLSAAWTFLVAAELIGAERGLGHFIAVSQRFLRLGDLYSGIVTFGIIGLLTDYGLEILSRRLYRWYYISLKQSNNGRVLTIPRDVALFRELALYIENPSKLSAASDTFVQHLVDGCIERLNAARMGGRSASLVGLSVILWTEHRRRVIKFDTEHLISLCFKIARDPSFIQPEWAIVLAGVFIARYTNRLEPEKKQEVLSLCRQLLLDLETNYAPSNPVCMTAHSLLETWDCDFKSGLDPVVQNCLKGWPDTAGVQSTDDNQLNEIIRNIETKMPGSLTERERSLYRLYLERKGEWKLFGLVNLK